MDIHIQISCPACLTNADTNPVRTSATGYEFPPIGVCACGNVKVVKP